MWPLFTAWIKWAGYSDCWGQFPKVGWQCSIGSHCYGYSCWCSSLMCILYMLPSKYGFQLHLYWLRVVGLFNLTPNLIVIYMIGVLCWTDCLVWTSLWAKGPTCQTLWWNFAKWYAIRYDSCFPFHSQHFLFVYHRHNPWDWTQQLDQTFVLWP